MEIKNNLQKLVDPYAQLQKTNQPLDKGAQVQAPAQPLGDRVSLSPEAKLLQEAHAAATNAPDVRSDKVAALKSQVEAGTYSVDSKTVAQKLLKSETELFGTLA